MLYTVLGLYLNHTTQIRILQAVYAVRQHRSNGKFIAQLATSPQQSASFSLQSNDVA